MFPKPFVCYQYVLPPVYMNLLILISPLVTPYIGPYHSECIQEGIELT